MDQGRFECAVVRGGTSRGIAVRRDALPESGADAALLSAFGSPDARQIDGLGGATPTTSKLMVVGPPERPDADVSFTFGQVGIEEATIEYRGGCGNMESAVGAFAVDEGLVEVDPEADASRLRLHNTNTDAVLEQRVPLADGSAATAGDFGIHGVPGTGARVETTYRDPAGTLTGELFPLGGPRTEIDVDGETIEASVVDVLTPVAFVRPAALGIPEDVPPPAVEETPELMERVARIRAAVCVRLGFVDDPADAATESLNHPKLAFVSPPTGYDTPSGGRVRAEEIDLAARVTSMPELHPVYAVDSAACTAASTRLAGTIPHGVARRGADDVTIGHPRGRMRVRVDVDGGAVNAATIARTQRRLMDGTAYY